MRLFLQQRLRVSDALVRPLVVSGCIEVLVTSKNYWLLTVALHEALTCAFPQRFGRESAAVAFLGRRTLFSIFSASNTILQHRLAAEHLGLNACYGREYHESVQQKWTAIAAWIQGFQQRIHVAFSPPPQDLSVDAVREYLQPSPRLWQNSKRQCR